MRRIYTRLRILAICCCILHGSQSRAQSDSSVKAADSTQPLREVVVSAYDQGLPARLTPASVSIVDSTLLRSYGDAGILQAVNSTPGVRMEERSPGSYRFGIRGSALEAPFGVRNVKTYYDGIPFTEPGGTTYLNALGFYDFASLEIIRGPGSSLYGAGTGGVLLINSQPQDWRQGISVTGSGGSYGLLSLAAEAAFGDSSSRNTVRYQHLESDGYRAQSALRRDVASYDANLKKGGHTALSAHFLYSDLSYETPGALTQKEYDATPEAARPGIGMTPGAVASKAAIFQKTLLAGFSAEQEWGSAFTGNVTLYGAYISQNNPNVRNYSRVVIPYFGGRASLRYHAYVGGGRLEWILGTELQQGFTRQQVYNNDSGRAVNLQSDGEVDNRQAIGFTQLSYYRRGWVFNAGASVDEGHITIRSFGAKPLPAPDVAYSQLAPRIAALRSITKNISVFAAIEQGFSPPSSDAIAPTGSALNTGLSPERGWNYEGGVRGSTLHRRLYFDMTLFYFRLTGEVIPRRDSAGGDFYVNAGSTDQKGLELSLKYALLQFSKLNLNVWASYTAAGFRYKDFAPLDKDYSGNKLPGVAPNTLAAGLSANAGAHVSGSISYFYSDAMPLNDANTASSDPYHLLSLKVDYGFKLRHFAAHIFAGGDNLLDERYSLGNDLNAVNNRYYNAAPRRSFFAGATIRYRH